MVVLLCGAGPVRAAQIVTTIDLDYSYSQTNVAGDVLPKTEYNQSYESKLDTALTSSLDLTAAARLNFQDAWLFREATFSRVTPSLELTLKGDQSSWKTTYETVYSTTEAFRESAEEKTYSSDFNSDIKLTPNVWPELEIKYKSTLDYEPYDNHKTNESLDVRAQKDISDMRAEFNILTSSDESVLPHKEGSDSLQWDGRVTYKKLLYGGTRFEVAYEVKEGVSEDTSRGVFRSESREYGQKVRTLLGNSLMLTTRTELGLAWEYTFEQDLLALEYDYKVNNKYEAKLAHELFKWMKLTGGFERFSEHTEAVKGADNEQKVTDTTKAGVEIEPYPWLQVGSRAEIKRVENVENNSGRSVDVVDEEKYETLVKTRFGTLWDLSLAFLNSSEYTNDWLTNREAEFAANLRLRYADASVQSIYEVKRVTQWDENQEDFNRQQATRAARIKFEYRRQVLELLQATFSHEYGVKFEDELDEVLNFEETVELNEDTRFTLVIRDLIRDTQLEGEISRKGSDTQDDPDPMLVDVSYSLKFDWKHKQISLSSTFKYNDKGNNFDDLSLNSRVGWKGERLDLEGAYEFSKILAEEKSEERKLKLRLKYKF